MNIKPTSEQCKVWSSQAESFAINISSQGRHGGKGFTELFDTKFAELAAAWGAEQAQQATPEGFVRVPLVMTQAMEEVTQQEDWQWADLLAAAEAVTEEQYNMVQAQQPPVEEPELPEAVAWLYTPGPVQNIPDEFIVASAHVAEPVPEGDDTVEPLFTATQMHDHFQAGVRAAGSFDGLPLVISGAIFDFAGFLTTRTNVIEVGSTANASPMADLVKEWAALRGLSLDDAAVLSWQEWLNAAMQGGQQP